MYSTHYKGILGELAFTYHLIEKGFTVLNPINHNSSYDLVIEKNGKFIRIQVKYRVPVKGVLRVELYRPKKPNFQYFNREVDAMGLYNPLSNKFYLIPLHIIKTTREFWIRVDKPKGKKTKSMHFAEEFEI
ncbi:MAG TPA: group I intron-associated PD-(D/E)XK endonuclease [Patescibacteria group bacterium]|nr:group I intron-associated PD-(D/E)XK endonuclease [Patescibacteria group bacterium]